MYSSHQPTALPMLVVSSKFEKGPNNYTNYCYFNIFLFLVKIVEIRFTPTEQVYQHSMA